MTEYDVISADTPEELKAAVRVALADGWEPQGGIAVSSYWYNENGTMITCWGYCQAMVKRSEVKCKPSKR